MSRDALTIVYVCNSCRPPEWAGETNDRPGAVFGRCLLARAVERGLDGAVEIKGVDCLSVCKRPCTVAVAGAGKFTYVIGDLDEGTSADEILDFALLHGRTGDGITVWRERPQVVRKNTVARVPPFAHVEAPVTDIDSGEA